MDLKNELILAEKIIEHARSKTWKNSDDYYAIIDLNYFLSATKQGIHSIEWSKILDRLRNGYYDEIYKNKEEK